MADDEHPGAPISAAAPPQPKESAAAEFGERVKALAGVRSIRIGKDEGKVRIVVDADKELDYSVMVLSEPQRVVVNLYGAWLGPDISREMDAQSAIVKRIRIGQFDPETVRVVIETDVKKGSYDVFSIDSSEGGAYRVVMDFGAGKGEEKPEKTEKPHDDDKKTPGGDVKKNAAPGKETGDTETGDTEVKKDPTRGKKKTDDDKKPPKGEGGDDKKSVTKREDTSDQKDKKKTEDKDDEPVLVEPVFTPGIRGKVIAIDPGHGGEDPGAIGPTGVTEKSLTLKISKELETLLKKEGAKVVLTRSTDTEVSPKHRQATDIEELQARCDIANKAKADIFISIHMDSFAKKEASGTTGYHYLKGTHASKRLAAAVQRNVVNRLKTESRGVKSCNFYVVKHTNMPAVLIEVAFVSNPAEEKLLNSKQGTRKAAEGILAGISDFFG